MNETEDVKGAILIIDDISDNIKIVAEMLKKENYKIHASISGKAGIKIAKLMQPRLILLDVEMPEMNGYEVCKILKSDEETREIPVIFLTGRNDGKSIALAFEAGGIDYISKPVKKLELIARVKTHIELSLAYKKILHANNVKDKFSSIIAHDLRGPIGGMMVLLKAVSDDYNAYEEKDIKEIIDEMTKSSETTYNLLENLLHWAKMSLGSINFEPKELDIVNLVKECIGLNRALLMKKSINLVVNLGNEEIIYGDENMLGIVFRNLISNGIKFSKENGSIEIGKIENKNKVGIYVKDHGEGMEKEKIKNILAGTNFDTVLGTAGEKGSGLGLVIVRDSLKKNNGEMMIESTQGVGSCFSVLFEKKNV